MSTLLRAHAEVTLLLRVCVCVCVFMCCSRLTSSPVRHTDLHASAGVKEMYLAIGEAFFIKVMRQLLLKTIRGVAFPLVLCMASAE
jgi:hypothetical protein